ncbi:hypothetical protein LWS67_03560 [Bacillus atrophaeus]|uniref:hypothetical protein n=1 Tax=Bacillus atrophaeus TaxID=1452 RepID=UPI001EFB5CC6|nr:hypothetical protein [Bacillus atrophaeus]MCG8395716.1 hypothetical protein [Bacillus atrophaeus]
MNRLIGESLACLVLATLCFMCGFLLAGVRLGMFSAVLSLTSSLGYFHGMRDGERKERDKQRI